MSITDELRQVAAKTETASGRCERLYRGDLERIADRIDAEHEKAAAGCIHYDSERHYCAVHGDTENGWVKLPVDADGVPIRVGDEMEPISVKYDRFGVVTLCMDTRDGRWSLLTDLGGEWSHDELCQLRHYHEPTVEDVLDEFANAVLGCGVTEDEVQRTIAEYAKRLRLKEGE